jgi:hypothetical protein
LDACHLKGDIKGKFYLVKVTSALRELYTVAIGISEENEFKEDWVFVL